MIATEHNYDVLETIYRSRASIIYRAFDLNRNQPVVIKTLAKESADLRRLNKLKNEYRLLRRLQSAYVVKPYAFLNINGRFSIIMEDFNAIALSEYTKMQPPTLDDLLDIAIKTCRCLGYVHNNGVIHKDLNPGNIVYNPESGALKLIDFGISSEYSFETPPFLHPNVLEGSLHYMSPEQTGRMNRPLDYRTDFYSLGVTLYELACNDLPFQSGDPAELVYSHVAVRPLPVHHINRQIPSMISSVISKLMAKMPEDRYQSVSGILHDLVKCRDAIDKKSSNFFFEPGQMDIPSKFEIPKKLYGREAEIEQLTSSFEKVCRGVSEVVMIEGYAGTGKTSLVNEIHKYVAKKSGIFISGKFEQHTRNQPFYAIFQALDQFCTYVLSEKREYIEEWKNTILNALSTRSGLICDAVPRLKLIIGEISPTHYLSPIEKQVRFRIALKDLILAAASAKHPIVLFLDDIHWADLASLELVEAITTDPAAKYLLLIATYRDNEVYCSHPLMMTGEKIRKNGVQMHSIHLGNLEVPALTDMINDAIKQADNNTKSLAQAVKSKTLGNPFFTIQFLKQCCHNKSIYYDHAANIWRWNETEIRSQAIAENTADYLIGEIQTLPPATQKFIALAACIGSRFDLPALAAISGKNRTNIIENLKSAIINEMVYASANPGEKPGEMSFKFCHDKFQQAAYQTLSPRQKSEIHYSLAQYYCSQIDKGPQILFSAAEHYTKALDRLATAGDIEHAIAIFLRTARAAILSSAFDTARYYLETVMDIALAHHKQDKSFLLHLYGEYHLVLFSLSLFQQMDEVFETLTGISSDPVDLVDIYCTQLISLSNRSRHEEAFYLGTSMLEKLGVFYPEENLAAAVENVVEKCSSAIHDSPPTVLQTSNLLENQRDLAAAKLLNRISPAALFFKPLASIWAISVNTNLLMEKGISSWGLESAAAFILGMISFKNDYLPGYKLTQDTLLITRKMGFSYELYRICHIFGLMVVHWFEPLENSIEYAHEAYKGNLQNGEFEFSCFSFFTSQVAMIESGTISAFQQENSAAVSFASRTKNLFALSSFVIFTQFGKAMRGETSPDGSFNDGDFNEDAYLQSIADNAISLCYYYIYRALSAVIFGDYELAFILCEKTGPLLHHIMGFYTRALHNFLYSLALCIKIEKAEGSDHTDEWRQKLKANQEWLACRAADAPCNYKHLHVFIEGLIEALKGNGQEALILCENAIRQARENHRTYHYALFCELLGKRCLSLGIKRIADLYLKEACSAYLLWEATGKTAAMKKEHPTLILSDSDIHGTQYSSGTTIYSDSLDLNAVLKATQTISRAMPRKQLQKKLMEIIIENSGSSRGCILLIDSPSCTLSTYELIDGLIMTVIDDYFIQESHSWNKLLPESVINYVARTREALIIGNVAESKHFLDNYFARRSPASLICFPILHQDILKGIIYLENDLIADAFTQKRLEILTILASHAAIFLENSALFSDLERKVEKRTRLLQQEIEKHRKTEKARRQSEELFFRAFHSSPVLMAIMSMKDSAILEINQCFLNLLGYTREEVLNCTPLQLKIWSRDEQSRLLPVHEEQPWAKVENVECKIFSKEGSHFFTVASTERISMDDDDCILLVMQNITEKKQYEANLFRMDRLNLIGEMAAGFGHEIRNPMTAIRGFLQMLRNNELYRQDHNYFTVMIEELDRANGIISDYLSMAKDKRIELRPRHLEEVIQSLYPIILADANYHEMNLKMELGKTPLHPFDEKEIRQMVLNMACNGLEAMPPGGTLTIGTYLQDNAILLYIKDQGPGIDPALFDRLGTPFVTTKANGTGLGLAVCYSIAARHNAIIDFDTGMNGTTFRIRFLRTGERHLEIFRSLV